MKPRTMMAWTCAAALIVAVTVNCEHSDPTAPADSTIVVSANPTEVDVDNADGRGSSRISALVLDEDGRSVTGVGVRFTTNFGTLASGGSSVKTDSDGIATDTLTLSEDDEAATVTARSGNLTGDVDVAIAGVNARPTARITITPASKIARVNTDITFSASTSTDPNGDRIEHYNWTISPPCTGCGGDVVTFHGSYAAATTVTVTLTVTDDRGLESDDVGDTVQVRNNQAPSGVTLQNSPTSPAANQTVNFSVAPGATDDGQIIRYEWDFTNDGTVDTATQVATTTHTYPIVGTTTARVKVFDDGDGSASCSFNSTSCPGQLSTEATVSIVVHQ